MTEVKYIREQVNVKGLTYSEVAKNTNRDQRVVKKYADMEDFTPEVKQKQIRKAPVMDPVKPILDKWILEDFKRKKKFRRTAKRMWEKLKKDHDFTGSERGVRDYVSKRKKELLEKLEAVDNASLPLENRPGMAQVDFGEAPFKYQGEEITLPYLVLSFPYSNAFYLQVFQSQNRECFLEGLKRIFNQIGGVPRAIRFDNLTPAVKKILPNGERQLTEEFQNFVLHYGFKTEFCNPNSGNEKGHVECMIKYTRNNILLPPLPVTDLEQLNHQLWKEAEADRQRNHYLKGKMIETLFKADYEACLMLPAKEYQCVRYETLKADKYGYVQVEKNRYSTSPRFASSKVLARISYNQVDILTEKHEVVVSHSRRYDQNQTVMEWQPYLKLIAKRPMALKYTSFYEQLPKEWQTYLNNCTVPEKSEALKLLSIILKDNDFGQITEALIIASEQRHPSSDSIKQVFYQLINGRGIRKSIQPNKQLPKMPKATRGLSHYDQLLKGAI